MLKKVCMDELCLCVCTECQCICVCTYVYELDSLYVKLSLCVCTNIFQDYLCWNTGVKVGLCVLVRIGNLLLLQWTNLIISVP